MKLIAGLGNPGRFYTDSRHNIGFSVIKALGKTYKIPLKKDNNTFSLSGKGNIDHKAVILALPLTYMNLSGMAVGALLKKYKIDLKDLLVICDDLDLELGSIKIKPGGSSAGHRGLASIMNSLEAQEFARLRIGIGRPPDDTDPADYVLSAFSRKERQELGEIIEKACGCCRVWADRGIAESMNIFNRRSRE